MDKRHIIMYENGEVFFPDIGQEIIAFDINLGGLYKIESYDNDNFYIIGQNNFTMQPQSKLEKWFPHNNVFDTMADLPKDLNERYTVPINWLNKNNVNLDYGIIVLGPVLSRNIPNTTYTLKGTIAKPLDRGKRSVAPVWHTLNETGIKWVCMSDDPRTLKLSQDLFNLPYTVFAQVNSILKNKNIISYEDQNWIETKIDADYKTIEISNCLDEKIIQVDDISRQTIRTKL